MGHPHGAGAQDTAGQERFHALGPIYYRDANGALLVFDITDEDSFQKVRARAAVLGRRLAPPLTSPSACGHRGHARRRQVRTWVKELRKMLGAEIPITIAGNKADLEKNRHVKAEEAEAYVAAPAERGGGGGAAPGLTQGSRPRRLIAGSRGAARYAQSVGAVYIETSAKLNRNVDQLFLDLTRRMLANSKSSKPGSPAMPQRPQGNTLVIVDDDEATKSDKKCC